MKRKVVFRIGKGKEEVEKVRWRLPEGKKQREEEEERELDFCFFTSLFSLLLFEKNKKKTLPSSISRNSIMIPNK